MNTACQELLENVVELVEGDLERVTETGLRAHCEACGTCARELRRQSALVAVLRSLPPAPDVLVPVPELEPAVGRGTVVGRGMVGGRGRFRIAAAAAIAAGLLVVAGARVFWGGGASGTGLLDAEVTTDVHVEAPGLTGEGRRIEIRTVVESTADVALPDDDLLALTAGAEAVVMRRPAQRR